MRSLLLLLAHLMLAMLVLELGNSLQGVVVPIRALREGFSTHFLGLLGTSYYAGFVLGCLLVPSVVHRVGQIRVFAGFASLAAAAVLTYELALSVPVWLILRAGTGFCFAGLYMAVESWLNDGATTETRGRILSVYTTAGWSGVIGGKFLFAWTGANDFVPFAVASISICLAVVPIAFTRSRSPTPAPQAQLRPRELYKLSPVGAVGCLGVGMANGAFWSLGPVYAASLALSAIHIALFISAAVLGGIITQWPLGKWSDRSDRRQVIAAVCLAGAGAGVGLALRDGSNEVLMFSLSLLFGACALPLYGLCIAHANDLTPADSFIEVSSDLLMLFGIGAVFGPTLAALWMTVAGPVGLFLFTGCVHAVLAGFTMLWIRRRPPIPAGEQLPFVSVRRTTPAALALDPRAERSSSDMSAELEAEK